MLEPEVESRPWAEQQALDADSYREQLGYLFERSPFYREKLGSGRDRVGRGRRRPGRDRAAAADHQAGDPRQHDCREPDRHPPLRRALRHRPHLLDQRHHRHPLLHPADRGRPGELGDGLLAQLRELGRERRGADRHDLRRGAVGRGGSARLDGADRALAHPGRRRATPSGCCARSSCCGPRRSRSLPPTPRYLIESAAERGVDLAGSSVERLLVAGEPGGGEPAFRDAARGGLGRAGDRGDGDRRHRGLDLGRVRGAGRDAPRGARVCSRGGDRSRVGRGDPDGGRRQRRDGADPPPASRGAAAAVPNPGPRRGEDEPLRMRPHRAPDPLHRAHRRHADRARRQRLPLRGARAGRRVRAAG